MLQPSPLESREVAKPKAGFRLPIDIFVAPARAFAAISSSRVWLPAYVIIVLLGLAELYLQAPALAHFVGLQSRAAAAATTPAEVRLAITRTFEFNAVWVFVGPFLLWGFVAALLFAVAAVTPGAALVARGLAGGFATCFSLCVNCAVPGEFGQLLDAAATRLHDPASFRTPTDFLTVLPLSLAALRPHGSAPEIAFLSYWELFTLWSLVLLGCGYAAIAKLHLVPALLLVLGVGLSLALTQVASGP